MDLNHPAADDEGPRRQPEPITAVIDGDRMMFQPVILCGRPGPVLVNAACRPGDLPAVGAGRRRALARIAGARVSRYCLIYARCAVRRARRAHGYRRRAKQFWTAVVPDGRSGGRAGKRPDVVCNRHGAAGQAPRARQRTGRWRVDV